MYCSGWEPSLYLSFVHISTHSNTAKCKSQQKAKLLWITNRSEPITSHSGLVILGRTDRRHWCSRTAVDPLLRPGLRLHLHLRRCRRRLLPPPRMLGIVTAALKIAASEYERARSGCARVAAVQAHCTAKYTQQPPLLLLLLPQAEDVRTPGEPRKHPGPEDGLCRRSFCIHIQNQQRTGSAGPAPDGGGAPLSWRMEMCLKTRARAHTHTGYIMLHINRPPPAPCMRTCAETKPDYSGEASFTHS